MIHFQCCCVNKVLGRSTLPEQNPFFVTQELNTLALLLYFFFFYFAINMIRTVQKQYRFVQPVIKNAFSRRCLATTAKDLENAYDVVIIGGGVAGVTLACSLGKNEKQKKKLAVKM